MRFPYLEGQRIENAGAVVGTSRGTAITANASPNAKGASFTTLLAATGFEADGLLVMLDDSAALTDYLLDIAVGGAGAEVVILSNLLISGGTGSITYGAYYYFPVKIPAGTRLSARVQASTGAAVVRVSLLLFSQGVMPGETVGVIDSYGLNTLTSGATSVDPGGSANTKGLYSQIVASTNRMARFLSLSIGNQLNGVRSSQSWLVDIAIGPALGEVVIVPNLALNCSTSPDIVVPQVYNMIPVSIPAGTRLAVRAQSDGIDAADRLFDAALYLAS